MLCNVIRMHDKTEITETKLTFFYEFDKIQIESVFFHVLGDFSHQESMR